MKYRNYDPKTKQPITAVSLLKSLSETKAVETDTVDINQLLSNIDSSGKEKDLTAKTLKKYSKIANLINSKVIKRNSSKNVKNINREHIKEFDDYLESKYPQAKAITNEKYSLIIKQRVKELIDEKN